METELEVKFYLENLEDFRKKLQKVGAVSVSDEKLYKRIAFHLPKGLSLGNGWGRIRDEGDKITLSIKVEEGKGIHDQKEICLEVDSLDKALEFMTILGFKKKSYQETKREKWKLSDVDITIDTWPFLQTFVEIEAKSVEDIESACKVLGFEYKNGLTGPVTNMYSKKYGISHERINNDTPIIVFNMENPFSS